MSDPYGYIARLDKSIADLTSLRHDMATTPEPPDPVSEAWAWDARKALVSPDSPRLVSLFATEAAKGVFQSMTIAVAQSVGGEPLSTPNPRAYLDASIPIPVGTKAGCSDDHHLVILGGVVREHDCWQAVMDSSGKLLKVGIPAAPEAGGVSFPFGAVSEPRPGNSNAARLPLLRGLVTPLEVANDDYSKPLVFSFPIGSASTANGKSLYPADTDWNGPVMKYGQWFRLAASVNVEGLGLGRIGRHVAYRLQNRGAFCRDVGATVSFFGQDMINQGGNLLKWSNVGVELPIKNGVGYPYAVRLGAIPWSKMEALQAPTP